MSDSTTSVSLVRLLKVLIPVGLIALAVNYSLPSFEKQARAKYESNMLVRLIGDRPTSPKDKIDFQDADGDLVADSPAEGVTPEKLVFSYIATEEETDEPEAWGDVLKALSEATGTPVEYQHFTTSADQLAAMARGELHVAGVNTGAVPVAVQDAGFVPVCTLGNDDGTFGYTMLVITKADSKLENPADLKGRKVVFTRPDSNSGFKAALALFLSEYKLQPERDYHWGFSYAHEASVRETIAGEHDAAPVASDILQRMTADGEVKAEDYRVVYESERFPPATIGIAHNLSADLRKKLSDSLLGFEWKGTSVEAKYGSSGAEKFVPVIYKDDWANIRRIDEAVASAVNGPGGA